jgi:hypothetical protein
VHVDNFTKDGLLETKLVSGCAEVWGKEKENHFPFLKLFMSFPLINPNIHSSPLIWEICPCMCDYLPKYEHGDDWRTMGVMENGKFGRNAELCPFILSRSLSEQVLAAASYAVQHQLLHVISCSCNLFLNLGKLFLILPLPFQLWWWLIHFLNP